ATSSAIVFLVPQSVSPGPAIISVRFRDAELSRGAATITATSPGIFILDGFDPSQPGAVENPDYSINDQAHPAQPGGFLQTYATGMGVGPPPLPKVFLGDVALEVLFSGVVGPGLWLVDAKIPDSFPYRGQIPLAITHGDIASNGATVWISEK